MAYNSTVEAGKLLKRLGGNNTLYTALWLNGMMNEIRRRPNLIPPEVGTTPPSMTLPFYTGTQKAAFGYRAGMSCITQVADDRLELKHIDAFPASILIALISVWHEARKRKRAFNCTLVLPSNEDATEFQRLLDLVLSTHSFVTVKTEKGAPSAKPVLPKRRAAGNTFVAQSIQQIDIGRFFVVGTVSNGTFSKGDNITLTDGDFNVLQENCPILTVSKLINNKDIPVANIRREDGRCGILIAFWFPPNTSFNSFQLVQEIPVPAFSPAIMPSEPILFPSKISRFLDLFRNKKTASDQQPSQTESTPKVSTAQESRVPSTATENPIIYENRAINADPPYVILKLDGAYYIQLFDLMCRRFFDITLPANGNYSIALFKLRDNELAWARNADKEKLDQLAKQLYERIPGDRFVKASLVTPSGQMIPLFVKPGCDSIDHVQADTTLQLNGSGDILSDAQKEKYVYSSLRSGVSLTQEYINDLSLGERLSVAFVTKNCPVHEFPAHAEKIKQQNCGFMLSMAADWLKHNPFYIVADRNGNPVKMTDKGIPFTCVFSSKQLAEKARNGNPLLQCTVIDSNKVEFWKQLEANGFVQIVADNNPLALTVYGCLIYTMAITPEVKKSDAASTQSESHPVELPKHLMLSQLPALYLKENNPFYREKYMEKLCSLGIKEEDAQKLFAFECGVIEKFGKPYLEDTAFVKTWFFGLKLPFFQEYPKTKEDILKEKSLTLSEICKLIDEAEWHFWNSRNKDLSDEVWEEIYAWRIQGDGGKFAISYFEKVAEDIGVARDSLSALSRENGTHLGLYKWI